MSVEINTSYVGEALEQLLIRATTGNELVSRSLVRMVPNIKQDYYLPRLKAGKMLQKRKEQPVDGDSKGNFNIDERKLTPKEVMAFTTFNPRAFEHIWRKWQPQGVLVFTELPPEAQTAMLSEMAKVVDFELGGHFINGVYADGTDDDKLFDGILTRLRADTDVVKIAAPVAITSANIISVLGKVYAAIPKALRNNTGMRILMSIDDFDKYDNALSDLPNKGTAYTDTNVKRFKGLTIETLVDMPENVIVATIATSGLDSNLWCGVSSLDDMSTVQVEKLTAPGERFFFKMLMKVDTQIAWGENAVLYDAVPAA